MWLLPIFSPVARAAAGVYYRVRYAGDEVPGKGPVLLVANHPNSLFDPTLVVAAARRPVRFLAKAPLFSSTAIGWLVKSAGAIPVYRRADDPSQMTRNEDAFRAVWDALESGAAVGIFPEGVSHSEPSLVPLRTGAARIALGAARRTGKMFPVIPVGLVYPEKDVFRSRALALRGSPVVWEDLFDGGPDDAGAVHEMTARIDAALRRVTLNLASWEDRPLVEGAVRIWEAERGRPSRGPERLARLELTTRVLAQAREQEDSDAIALSEDVRRYLQRIQRLGLRPSDIVAEVKASRGIRFAVARLYLVMPVAGMLAVAGMLPFWPPYWLTGVIVRAISLERDLRSTWKLLVGAVLYLAWLALLVSLAAYLGGPMAALVCLPGIPAIALLGLMIRERWSSAWHDLRRFIMLRGRRAMIAMLSERQHDLGRRLNEVVDRF